MISLIDRLKKGEILICDGAMGTSLQALGLEAGQAPEEWNILNPEKVKKVHKSFIDAGCDMIITNTFGANPVKLKRAGLEEKFVDINTAAVKIAKEAAKNVVYVLGDIGPTGEFLKPIGNYNEEDFYAAFSAQAKMLAGSGVDAFIIETMSALDESRIAVSACKAIGLPVIASMTFNKTEKGYRTMTGISVEQAAVEFLKLNCDCFGANCGCGSRQMVEIMKEFRKTLKEVRHCEESRACPAKLQRSREAGRRSNLLDGREIASPPAGARNDDFGNVFLIAQPNAGMPKLVKDKTVFDETPADFAKSVRDLVDLGVNIIGGCCGTVPEHIKEIAKIIKR